VDETISKALFKAHPPSNPNPNIHQSNTIPRHLDQIPTCVSVMNYAEKLKQSISSTPNEPNKDRKFLHQPLLHKQPLHYVYDPNGFPSFPNAKAQATPSSSS